MHRWSILLGGIVAASAAYPLLAGGHGNAAPALLVIGISKAMTALVTLGVASIAAILAARERAAELERLQRTEDQREADHLQRELDNPGLFATTIHSIGAGFILIGYTIQKVGLRRSVDENKQRLYQQILNSNA